MAENLDLISELSFQLYEARKEAQEQEPLTLSHKELDLSMAYRIQAHGIELRRKDGESVVGYKMGLTSKAKMEQMGLHQPIFGVLTDRMQVSHKGEFSLAGKIHPKAEPEIFFVTHKELSGRISVAEAISACSEVGVALEILDSRFRGFKYFALPDVVADNSSSAFFVLGDRKPVASVKEIKNLRITIELNDDVASEAKGDAILGDPWLSLCELVSLLSQENKSLPAGSIVLAGAATQAIQLEPNMRICARLDSIGTAEFIVRN